MMTRPDFVLWKACTDLTDDEIEAHRAMLHDSFDVTYETLRRNVGAHSLDGWAAAHGYVKDARHGLTLKKDWHVNYSRSTWNGVKCYYLTWSAFEFIWRGRNDLQIAAFLRAGQAREARP
jgi:hypothetical protein